MEEEEEEEEGGGDGGEGESSDFSRELLNFVKISNDFSREVLTFEFSDLAKGYGF